MPLGWNLGTVCIRALTDERAGGLWLGAVLTFVATPFRDRRGWCPHNAETFHSFMPWENLSLRASLSLQKVGGCCRTLDYEEGR